MRDDQNCTLETLLRNDTGITIQQRNLQVMMAASYLGNKH